MRDDVWERPSVWVMRDDVWERQSVWAMNDALETHVV
jgi:hypothetical protein